MNIKEVEMRVIELPLVRPFRTSFGTQHNRELLLMKINTREGVDGWSECVAMSEPRYSPEYTAGCQDVIERFLLPTIFRETNIIAEEIAPLLKQFLGHQMSKAAIEASTAVMNA